MRPTALRRLRNQHKQRQKVIADLLGVTQPTVSKLERGVLFPDEEQRQILAKHFDVDPRVFEDTLENEEVEGALLVLSRLPAPRLERAMVRLYELRSADIEDTDA